MSLFEKTIDRRNTRSVKWDLMETVYQLDDASDILPMWVADMDFAAPPAVREAIRTRLEHPVFGYSYICEECRAALSDWLLKRHGWKTDTVSMLFHQGVIPAMAAVLETFTEPGDGILVTTPVYPPFFDLPKKQDRTVIFCELAEDGGRYSIDFEKFEESLRNVKLFILCNPHNPGGKVWSEDELKKIIELCARHDVLILSDEIHADLVLEPHYHTPTAKLAGDEEARIITCVAPTKTFNLAGIQAAVMIVPDEQKRRRLEQHAAAHGQLQLNAFAAPALKAAYEEGGPWLDELKTVLSANMDQVIRDLTAAIPGIRIQKPEATYLMWIDYRQLGISEKEAMEKLLKKGKIALEPGTKYGKGGEGFLRMNIACPPETLAEGIRRIIRAFS